MKKQILFLTFLSLAFVFAGLNEVFGQSLPSNILPQPLAGCDDYPLHPKAGVPYKYEVSNDTGDTPIGYTWWTTKNLNFIDINTSLPDTAGTILEVGKPGELIAAGPRYGEIVTDSLNTSIEITWSPEILAGTEYDVAGSTSPTFVVVMANGACTNNLSVFEINPLPSFTVDIANVDPLTYTTLPDWDNQAVEQCVDSVRGAVYDGAGSITMNYGWDTLYFEVVASNFVDNWTPYFNLVSGLTAPQTAVIGWSYTMADAIAGTFIDGESVIAVGGEVAGSTPIITNEVNTVNGVSIYVRVVISNNGFESLAEQDFVLAVDGVDGSPTPQWDLVNATCDDPGKDLADQATHKITPRPNINGVPPTIDDGTIDPNDFDPKN